MFKNILYFLLFQFAYTENYLHLTDIHLDRFYSPGSPNKCVIGSRIGTRCCRKTSIPINDSENCGEWGDLNSDTSPKLLNGILSWITTNIPNITAIFQTGDDSSHHDITQTPSNNIENSRVIGDMLKHSFPNVPIFNAVGNHDTYPIDQTTPWIYTNMMKEISNIYRNTTHENGYYSASLNSDIQVISFNPIFYDSNNIFKLNYDKNHQFKWLKKEFSKSYKNIIFLTHIPINGGESTKYYNCELRQNSNEFRSSSIASFIWT